jgi:polyisoprenyl-phosphate glycosyltransferase
MPKKSPRKFISIVVPIYNEEEVIPELIRQLHVFADAHKQYRYEFILVEHGSKDSSYKLLQKQAKKDKRLKVLQLAKNVECDGGLVAGMNFASGDACVLLMADLQEPLSVVTKFFKQWEKGYEIVYGVVKKRTGGRIRNLNSRIFYKVMNLLTGNVFPENVSDFRLMDKKVYKAIIKMPEQNKYLRGLVMWTGFSSIGVEFARVDRFAGESKADFKTVLKVASNGIFSFSYFPLRFVTFLGLAMTGISFLMILFYFYLYLINGQIAPGVNTIIILLLFLFGVLFFVLGIISEYLARIYEEAKGRPHFLVKNKVNL